MKDYKLSEIKAICNDICHNCHLCTKNYPELHEFCMEEIRRAPRDWDYDFDTEDKDKEEK